METSDHFKNGAYLKSHMGKKNKLNENYMKKTIVILIGFAFILSSCAINSGLTTNLNNLTTEVVLSKKNFKVIDIVQGKSQAMHIFGIGGLSKSAMIAEAKADMVSKANIIGSSRAIINETTEIQYSYFPIVRLYRVTV